MILKQYNMHIKLTQHEMIHIGYSDKHVSEETLHRAIDLYQHCTQAIAEDKCTFNLAADVYINSKLEGLLL